MRTLSANETAALAAPSHRKHLRCQIKDSGGTWRDTSSLSGWHWLVSAEIDEDVDAYTTEARITLRRGGPGKDSYLSTAPGIESSPLNTLTGSYAPLVALFREIKLELALMPQDTAPAAGDWKLWFHGRIDSFDSAGEELGISARDLGGYLVDAFIEVEREYCATDTAVETLMQAILTDNVTGITVPTLRTVGSPSWVITKYKQQRMAIMEALQTVAQQNGWQLRYAYDSSAGDYKLTYSQPNRSATGSVYTLNPADYWNVNSVNQHVGGIRNVIQVWFFDAADLDNTGKPIRKSVSSAADAAQTASITKYGRRWMQLVEEASSLIDSAAEAQTLADAIKADLCEPLVDIELEARLLPHLELGDMILFKANHAHFTSDQTLAVVGMTHSIGPMDENGACLERTSLRLRGKPVAQWRGWLAQDAGREGVTETAPYLPPPAIASPTITPTIGGATIKYTPPTDPRREWVETELHLALSSGYTPSSATLRARTSTNAFVVTDLTPGLTYYGRLIGIDAYNNTSTGSAEFTVVPMYLTTSLMRPEDADLSSVPINGGFSTWSNGLLQPPDHWESGPGTWGTNFFSSTDSYSGGYAIRIYGALRGQWIRTKGRFPVEGNARYLARMAIKNLAYAAAGAYFAGVILRVSWYRADGSMISATTALEVVSKDDGWSSASVAWGEASDAVVTAPSDARLAMVHVLPSWQADMYSEPIYGGYGNTLIDSVGLLRVIAARRVYPTSSTGDISNLSILLSADGFAALAGYVTSGAGGTDVTLFSLPTAARPLANARFFAVQGTAAVGIKIQTDGSVTCTVSASTQIYLDGIRWPIAVN